MAAFRTLMPNVRIWSIWSAEKQIDFNGTLIQKPGQKVLIDPVPMTPEQVAACREGGAPSAIIITNKDHRRAAPELKAAFGGIPIYAPEADRDLIDGPVDETFRDGDELPGDLLAIHLLHMKSPGETALFRAAGLGLVILGDALWGKPAGSVTLLPPAKVPDPVAAKRSLARLLEKTFDVLMVGDGAPIARNAKKVLESFVQS